VSSEAPARFGGRDLLTLLVTGATIALLDQATKALVAATVGVGDRVGVIGDVVIIWHLRNTGASFSLFQFDGSQVLFLAVTLLAFALIASFHRTFRGHGLWLQVLLGLVLGGTVGNFIDRVRFGYVTDWLSVGFGATRFPAFNVADASLVVGMAALVAVLLFADPQRVRQA
jgi:signal peptidase II